MALTSALFTGLSGLDVNQTRLSVVGNNIANVNTVAFKSSRALFKPQFYVTDSGGTVHTLRAGDTAHFASGSSTTWEIPDYLKKLAVHRSPATLPDRLLSKAMRLASRA